MAAATAYVRQFRPVPVYRPVIPVREATAALRNYTVVRNQITRSDLRISVGQLGVDQAVNVLVGQRIA